MVQEFSSRSRTMKDLVVACVALTCVAMSSASPWEDRGSTGAEVTSVQFSGCDDGVEYCELIKDSTVDVTITFRTSSAAKSLKVNLYFVMLESYIPKTLDNSNACSVLECPLKDGETYTYRNSFKVENVFGPKYDVGRLDVYWLFKDENGKQFVHISVPCNIVEE